MIVGFTGSSTRITLAQLDTMTYVLGSFRITEFRHGDCVQGDELAHKIVLSLPGEQHIEIHPPLKEDKRAFCEGWTVMHDPKPFLERDDDIARACNVLVAAPDNPREQIRSGTWTTIRYARRYGKLIIRCNPDGSTGIG